MKPSNNIVSSYCYINIDDMTDTYSEPSQISKMESFEKNLTAECR